MINSLWSNKELGIKNDTQKCGLGLLYAGSKKKLSVDIFNAMLDDCDIEMPFVYDIFGGGGALAFQAAYSGMNVLYNDLNEGLYRLFKELNTFENSNFRDFFYNNFVTDIDFKNLRDSNDKSSSITALLNIYSYGGLMAYYTYNKDDVSLKKHAHYLITQNSVKSAEVLAMFYKGRIGKKSNVYNLFFDLCDYFKGISIDNRYSFFQSFIKKIEALCLTEFYDYVKKWDIVKFVETSTADFIDSFNQKLENKINSLTDIKGFDYACLLKHFSVFNTVMNMANAPYLNKMSFSCKSFENVDIIHKPDECVILCDIPYKAVGWRLYKQNIDMNYSFDFEKFYNWVRELGDCGYKVYICEYEMPPDFKVIMEKDYLSTFSSEIIGGKKVKERLYTYDKK